MMARVELRQVLGEAVESGASVKCANAKTIGTWDALVILCLFEHNWLRPHRALREAGKGLPEGRRYRPAMAIGLTDHIWTWEEFLTLSIPKGVTIVLPDVMT